VPSPATSSVDAFASVEEDSTEDTVGDHGMSMVEEALGALVASGEGALEVLVTSVVDPFPSVLSGNSSPNVSEAS
jgi:hypothetical protein